MTILNEAPPCSHESSAGPLSCILRLTESSSFRCILVTMSPRIWSPNQLVTGSGVGVLAGE